LAEAQFPSSLEALVPRYLRRVPHDVIDGQPLRFQINHAGSYSLYSVGWNGADDSGNVAFKKDSGSAETGKRDWVWQETRSGLIDITQGDWVWRIPF
jgi:hypothetical protein